MANLQEVDIDVNVNVFDKDDTLKMIKDFLAAVPEYGIANEGFDMLDQFVRETKLRKRYAFGRAELNAIQMRAREYARLGDNPEWKRAYEELAWAACVVDAFVARSALPKGTSVEAPENLDSIKMLSKMNLGKFKLQIWEHGMFVSWQEQNHSHQKWIDFAKLD